MCGITGIINLKNESPSRKVLSEMSFSLKHRGPDDEGLFIKNNVGFAFRRLSIVDINTGNQPILNEDSSIVLIFNGEIYNYEHLREELLNNGHTFKSTGDAEVLIHLYEEYKEDMLSKLRGMFSFALYDFKDNKFFAARDRLGKKPFYYTLQSGHLIFSSELKAILKHPSVKKEIDLDSLDLFMSYRYIPKEYCAVKGIKKLLPGHCLILKENSLNIIKYWDLDFSNKTEMSFEEASESVENKIIESVRIRLKADVPVGLFLSGGLDSAMVLNYMSRESAHPINTYSVIFDQKEYSEQKYSAMAAKIFSSNHNEILCVSDINQIFEEMPAFFDEPYADSSAIAYFAMTKVLKNKIKCVLCGDGGDENFAGYDWYNFNDIFYFWDILPHNIKKIFSKLRFGDLKKYLDYAQLSYPLRYLRYVSYFRPEHKNVLYKDEIKYLCGLSLAEKIMENTYYECKSEIETDKHLYCDFKIYLPDDLNVKVDRASMANHIEVRSPLLDHELVEFCASLPSNFKIKNKENKIIFKKIAEKYLPKEIIYRKKQGFSVPLKKWMAGDLGEKAKEIIFRENSACMKFFKKEEILRMFKTHEEGKVNYAGHLWSLLNFELWYSFYMD
ncbi:MAG: asparagine synthase (glutamine-hydrolyzing) [Elusimicrobia bacterium]|nr:asparagine synthase (glutamine-hydrolyzing) [Elusimicrobiota bacterium]